MTGPAGRPAAPAVGPAAGARDTATGPIEAGRAGGPRVSWVLDPRDDAACVRALLELHQPAAGRVVCHPRPSVTWPALVEDLLRALGKHSRSLSRERCTAHGPRLLRVWLRAEPIRHLVVLRAHRLAPTLLSCLVDLAAAADVALWLVWHRHHAPALPHPRAGWAAAVDALLSEPAAAPVPRTEREVYAEAFAAARHEARVWRPDGHRLGSTVPPTEHAWPGCDVGALLQRLTIDAATGSELRARLRAAQHGFAAEGRRLTLPDLDPATVAALGPRLDPATATSYASSSVRSPPPWPSRWPPTPNPGSSHTTASAPEPSRSTCSPASTASPTGHGPYSEPRSAPTASTPRTTNRCSPRPVTVTSARRGSRTAWPAAAVERRSSDGDRHMGPPLHRWSATRPAHRGPRSTGRSPRMGLCGACGRSATITVGC